MIRFYVSCSIYIYKTLGVDFVKDTVHWKARLAELDAWVESFQLSECVVHYIARELQAFACLNKV